MRSGCPLPPPDGGSPIDFGSSVRSVFTCLFGGGGPTFFVRGSGLFETEAGGGGGGGGSRSSLLLLQVGGGGGTKSGGSSQKSGGGGGKSSAISGGGGGKVTGSDVKTALPRLGWAG